MNDGSVQILTPSISHIRKADRIPGWRKLVGQFRTGWKMFVENFNQQKTSFQNQTLVFRRSRQSGVYLFSFDSLTKPVGFWLLISVRLHPSALLLLPVCLHLFLCSKEKKSFHSCQSDPWLSRFQKNHSNNDSQWISVSVVEEFRTSPYHRFLILTLAVWAGTEYGWICWDRRNVSTMGAAPVHPDAIFKYIFYIFFHLKAELWTSEDRVALLFSLAGSVVSGRV